MNNTISLIDSLIYINGKPVDNLPKPLPFSNTIHVTQTKNDNIYINGYKYVDGEWEFSIMGIFMLIFH